jgi:SWI/SNF-related matrix-associated actin-dependent regulator of chromatin subfamily A3
MTSIWIGKTIVIISLVAKTLDFARSWALNKPIERESADPRFGSFVGATSASKEKLKMSSEYAQNLFGADPEGFNGKQSTSGSGSGTSKKQIAKAKKEARREAAVTSRFDRLIVKSRATLIVCPLSTMQNWESQFAEHIGNPDDNEMGQEGKKSKKPLSIYIYHGSSRTTDALDLTKYDVVLTTFSTVAAEYSKQDRAFEQAQQDLENGGEKAEEEIAPSSDDDMLVCDEFGVPVVKEVAPMKKAARKRKRIEGSGDSPLQQVQWYRIVLDEAHIIKEYLTIQARAACDLSASRRIALSGTPIQNSLNDLVGYFPL